MVGLQGVGWLKEGLHEKQHCSVYCSSCRWCLCVQRGCVVQVPPALVPVTVRDCIKGEV